MSDRGSVVAEAVVAEAPGRVNLIGDHTDYAGGPALPMAVDLTTVLDARPGGTVIRLRSDRFPGEVEVPLPAGDIDPAGDIYEVGPAWGRLVAAVARRLGATEGFIGELRSTVPPGAGLSSSAALEVAVALALLESREGGDDEPVGPFELATMCRDAEEAATGVPCGTMDQLCILTAREGSATLVDPAGASVSHVPLPREAAVWVVDSGTRRHLATSAYAARRRDTEAATALVGPLPTADASDIEAIRDPVLRRRARHVHTESRRVWAFRAALETGDLPSAGRLMVASHESLRDDHDVSTAELDRLVERLCTLPGVFGARLTGAGFGGSVVALAEGGGGGADGPDLREVDPTARRVRPSRGARVRRR